MDGKTIIEKIGYYIKGKFTTYKQIYTYMLDVDLHVKWRPQLI
jgi:hypothetical protein